MVGFPIVCNDNEPGNLSRMTRHVGTHRTTLSFLSNNLPDRNSKLVIAKDGSKFCESPLLSKWGDITR